MKTHICEFCHSIKDCDQLRYFYNLEKEFDFYVCYACITELVLEEYYSTDCRSLAN